MTKSTTPSPYLRSGQTAARLGVSITTIRRWTNRGLLHAIVLPSGHRRFRVVEVEALRTSIFGPDGPPDSPE